MTSPAFLICADLRWQEGRYGKATRSSGEVLSGVLIRGGHGPARRSGCGSEPELTRMCWTWFSAVRSETNRASPICLLVSPRATRRATSSSRGLSGEAGAVAGSRARSCAIRAVNGTMPSRSASPAAASSAARARSRSPGACGGPARRLAPRAPARRTRGRRWRRRSRPRPPGPRPPRPGGPAPRPTGRGAAPPAPCKPRRRHRWRRAGRGTARTARPGTRCPPCGPSRRRLPARGPSPTCASPATAPMSGSAGQRIGRLGTCAVALVQADQRKGQRGEYGGDPWVVSTAPGRRCAGMRSNASTRPDRSRPTCSADWDKITARAPIATGWPMSLNTFHPSRASRAASVNRPVASASVAASFQVMPSPDRAAEPVQAGAEVGELTLDRRSWPVSNKVSIRHSRPHISTQALPRAPAASSIRPASTTRSARPSGPQQASWRARARRRARPGHPPLRRRPARPG